jgi:hypothetical protein
MCCLLRYLDRNQTLHVRRACEFIVTVKIIPPGSQGLVNRKFFYTYIYIYAKRVRVVLPMLKRVQKYYLRRNVSENITYVLLPVQLGHEESQLGSQ